MTIDNRQLTIHAIQYVVLIKSNKKGHSVRSSLLFMDKDYSYLYASPLTAAMPGRTLPSIASNRAPPPVEKKETPLASPHLMTQATETPPPTNQNAPFLVASTIASPTAREPSVKFSNSNTPVGPFHRIVLEFLITSA